MKKCIKCGKLHEKTHPHFREVDKLTDKGFPTHAKRYKTAHRSANKDEKKAFGEKSFKALEKISRKVSSHELIGKNTRSGKVEVSSKVPKKYRNEVAYHEKKENDILRRKNGKVNIK
jgi:hypothetical protein